MSIELGLSAVVAHIEWHSVLAGQTLGQPQGERAPDDPNHIIAPGKSGIK